ncbi:hypothetical protein DPEC_G00137670 [Dallia pectoralis]|uniref:Uncharacterized protein n=1 Tax=Dallia pectoralis TaxID=75939 RepID=A0ACC2GLZ7_DALPE|nr:hypothetical protein DPEC_G00137670 [Dallia pectoralis]
MGGRTIFFVFCFSTCVYPPPPCPPSPLAFRPPRQRRVEPDPPDRAVGGTPPATPRPSPRTRPGQGDPSANPVPVTTHHPPSRGLHRPD